MSRNNISEGINIIMQTRDLCDMIKQKSAEVDLLGSIMELRQGRTQNIGGISLTTCWEAEASTRKPANSSVKSGKEIILVETSWYKPAGFV